MSESKTSLLERIDALAAASRALDPGAGERERLRRALVDAGERFLESLATRRAYDESGDRAARLLEVAIGEDGIGLEEVVERLERDVIAPGGHPASGAHLAYIPGGGVYHSALADYLAAVTNKYAGIFFTGPGPVRMENLVVRWVADLVGYPAEAAGSIASGGSIANLTAVTTARDAHGLRGADYARAVVYLTTQAHHCIEKSIRIAGMGEAQVRCVPMDDGFRMRPEALEEMIAADRAAGLRPWMIIAAAGTTDAGAVDPLDAIADIAERERCWFHVDAAYGGFFMLTEHGRRLLRGIERSDSVVLDPHKSLFLPWGCGVVVVRDAAPLLAAHAYTGAYLQDAMRAPGEISPADTSPELTKPFRALRMWLPLVLLGTAPFRAALDEKLLLARYFRDEMEALGFEVGEGPDLTVVTYRWIPPGAGLAEANAFNERLVEAVRHDGRVFISSTMLGDVFVLRMVALGFRTHRREIDLALEVLRTHLEALSG
jgi:glutamate/tyrosine decarboxylase-like PLP-dependent enzyme